MQSDLRFIRRSAEFLKATEISHLKNGLRGIYVLYKLDINGRFNVQYIGMSRGDRFGMKGRLRAHRRSKRKSDNWTHFSIFEVWDNVTKEEIEELEGFARHLYRHDSTANTMNIQRGYKKLRKVRKQEVGNWA